MPKILDFSAPEEDFESILDMEDESENLAEGELEMPFSKNLLEKLNLVGFKVFVEYYNDFSFCDDEYIKQRLSANENYEDSVCEEKISAARNIIEEGLGREALEIIICSNKVDAKTIQLAQVLIQGD